MCVRCDVGKLCTVPVELDDPAEIVYTAEYPATKPRGPVVNTFIEIVHCCGEEPW